MAALKLDLSVPFGGGHAQLIIDVRDLAAVADDDRAFLASTVDEFCAFAARNLAPLGRTDEPAGLTAAVPFDPDAAVLAGVTGSRAYREKP